MADFRKWLYAFAVVALLAGLTAPASAQQTFQTCIGGAVNPTVRAEGYTELAGDITITCSGGVLTTTGNTVPAVTITVSMNTSITSKLTSTAFNPNFNEALLLIDEPGLGAAGAPLLNCGNAPNAPFDIVAGTGVCKITADGTATYGGTAGHPNVFQGRQVTNSSNQSIQFIGVPLDGGTHTLRITNLRGNAVQISGGNAGTNFSPGLTFNTFVTFTSPNSVNAQLINVTNGSIRQGLTTVSGTSMGPFLQCIFTSATTRSGATVTLTEGFPSAFKARNWRQINDNGTYVFTPDWQYTPPLGVPVYNTADLAQNVPNAFYETESGFMYPPAAVAGVPAPNPPPGISNATGVPAGDQPFTSGAGDPTGISSAGTVTNGTRFAVAFSNIPAGTTITVPGTVPLTNISGGTGQTGVLVTVNGTDADGSGSGGTVSNTGTITSGANFEVFYEVVFADPIAIEQAVIPVTANIAAFNGSAGTPQVNVTATAQASFAPFYANTAGTPAGSPLLLGHPLTASTGPIARFFKNFLPNPPVNLYSFTRCACDLLFPFVVADNTYTSDILIANTSLDPGIANGFVASPQAGTVTFWFFGTAGLSPISGSATNFPVGGPGAVIAPQTTTVSIPAGSYAAFIISPTSPAAAAANQLPGLGPIMDAATGKVPTNFAGYVIAQSQFQYCHGVASITAPGLSPQTYLGLVLDKGVKFNFNLNTSGPNNGLNPFSVYGVELPRTNQAFADELEN